MNSSGNEFLHLSAVGTRIFTAELIFSGCVSEGANWACKGFMVFKP